MTALEVSEIKAMMSDLEKAGSAEKIISLLTVFEERVRPTEKLLRVCISLLDKRVLCFNVLTFVLLGNETGHCSEQIPLSL